MSSEKYTVGVDFGTLSGRALVVRVGDGHELASAEHAYEHGVITDALPGSAVRLPSQWALQVPRTTSTCCAPRCRRPSRRAGIDPADVIGIGTDFTACTMVPVRATARRCASSTSSPTDRTPTPSCGATTRRSRRPTASMPLPPNAVSRGCRGTAA